MNMISNSHDNVVDLIQGNKIIRIKSEHYNIGYYKDIIGNFNHYFDSVLYTCEGEFCVVDFSKPKWHHVKNYEKHPIHFPSFVEPYDTTSQYTEFAELKEGQIVLDLGAYSGLTSIIFKDLVGNSGRVISVEPDETNIKSLKRNFEIYSDLTGKYIDYFFGAVWRDLNGINFSTEGNMGSSSISLVGNRSKLSYVSTITLNQIMIEYDLKSCDFIKCDIEGAEQVVFETSEDFFKLYKPRIIIECHGSGVDDLCISHLCRFNYKFEKKLQQGSRFPLLCCY